MFKCHQVSVYIHHWLPRVVFRVNFPASQEPAGIRPRGEGRQEDRKQRRILFLVQIPCTLNLPSVLFGLSLLPAVRQLFVNFPLLPISVWKQQIDFKWKYLKGSVVWVFKNPGKALCPSPATRGYAAGSFHPTRVSSLVQGAGEPRPRGAGRVGGGELRCVRGTA